MSSSMLPAATSLERIHNGMWAVLALCSMLSAASFLWTLRPLDPVPKLALTVLGPTRTGADLEVRVDYCKTEGFTPSAVRWSLVDGVTIMLPPTVVTLAPGCRVTILLLPGTPHMTPGVYLLRVDGIYTPYPWRSPIIVSASSPPFEVTQ